LGKDSAGKYVCFQKQGPEIEDRFEITELDPVLKLGLANNHIWKHLAFIGPLK
jgi:hypothetical protein